MISLLSTFLGTMRSWIGGFLRKKTLLMRMKRALMRQNDDCDPELTELERLRIKSTQDGPRKKEADRRRRRRAMLKALQEKSNA